MGNKHDYLFSVSAKKIDARLLESGSGDSRTDESIDVAIDEFFKRSELVDDNCKKLTEEGKELFNIRYVYDDLKEYEERIADILIINPVVVLICQSFWGRGKIRIEQLLYLLASNDVCTRKILYSDVVSLLVLLNHYNIVAYDKRNKSFSVKRIKESDVLTAQYYIVPNTPFSNKFNLKKIIQGCEGHLFWIDKHFRKEGLDFIFDGSLNSKITAITIISGCDNVTQSAKSSFFDLKTELLEMGISCEWRVIRDKSFMFHDRWLLSDNLCYNIPPILAIIRGQRSELLKTKQFPDIELFLESSEIIQPED